MEALKKRLLDIAYRHKLSHLGSCLSALPIIDKIYRRMEADDIFILSSGHAALALYVVLERYRGQDAEQLFMQSGVHPTRNEEHFIHCSTGSLGNGICIAVGRALANKNRRVFCCISDGETNEGSVWEALRFIADNNIDNLHVYCNMNGYSAYDELDTKKLAERLYAFLPSINIVYTSVEQYPFLKGLNAHYHIMKDEDYNSLKQNENSGII